MKEPVLVVMAAGMGSRYGGLKQIDPVDSYGNVIIDYSLYDARRAGFRKAVIVIKKEDEEDFHNVIGDRLSKIMKVRYAYQQMEDLPEGFTVPEGRTKPWGTAHAIMAVRDLVDGPFAVINADDYYGTSAFGTLYNYLCSHPDGENGYEYAMVGYLLENTVTEHGTVSRGVCEKTADGFLTSVVERTKIEKGENCPRCLSEDGQTWLSLPGDTIVSMNLWGFQESFLKELMPRFRAFLGETLKTNPMKGEFYLPGAVSQLLEEGKARVKVLSSMDKWYGVTYKEDKPTVVKALQQMREQGIYPEKLRM